MSTYYQDYDDEPPTVELPAIELHSPVLPLSEAPRKVCDRCRAASRTHEEFCPYCAARYPGGTPAQRLLRTLVLTALILAGLVAAGAMTAAYSNAMSSGAAGQSVEISSESHTTIGPK
jgi:hypothetical protein